MKTTKSFGVYFNIKKAKAKDGRTNVWTCITINKDKCFTALKKVVDAENWDFGIGTFKSRQTNLFMM
jgi:hypothetical protein